MEVDKKYIEILEQYNDKSFVYSVLCSKASRYYNYLRLTFAMPLILTSTVMSYLNGINEETMVDKLKIVNSVFNITTAVLLAIQNIFKFESKSNEYKQSCSKFQKLSHQIEAKLLKKQEINDDFITSIINQYDNIQEDCMDIPSHICNAVRREYATRKHLPILINGIEKLEKEQSMSSKIEYLNRLSV